MRKRLLQFLLVTIVIVACGCAVACKTGENKKCVHKYAESVVAATCTEGGYTEHKCSKCGDTYRDNETPALGHDLTWTTTLEATCSEKGKKDGACSRCDYTEKDVEIPTLEHDMTEWAEESPATCAAAQVLERHCKRNGCNGKETKDGKPALGHSFVESTDDPSIKEPTCTEGGLKVEICNRDGCTERRETPIPPIGHTPDGKKADVVEATCTLQGYTTYHCAVCGVDYKDDFIEPLGHDWEEKEAIKVSCLHDGCDAFECKRCHIIDKRNVVPKYNHEFDENGVCTKGCGKTIDDKITWLQTEMDVTYNETDDRLTVVGGDPATVDSEWFAMVHNVKIPAELLAKKKAEGFDTFKLNMFMPKGNYLAALGIHYILADGTVQKHFGGNNSDYSSDEITITDEMLLSGYSVLLEYTDMNQRKPTPDPAYDVITGFDFDITFIKAVVVEPFDIADKDTWFITKLDGSYNASKDRWVFIGGDTKGQECYNAITIRKELLTAMKNNGMTSFTIGMMNSKDGQSAMYVFFDETRTKVLAVANINPIYYSFDITDEMCENGLTIVTRYHDLAQADPENWPATEITDGFDFSIEFVKPFNIDDKDMWLQSEFATVKYSAEKGMWAVNDADPGVEQISKNITIQADVFNALPANVTMFSMKMFKQIAEQNVIFAYRIDGAWNEWQDNLSIPAIEITDAMRANGYTIKLLYGDKGQRTGADLPHVTGFDLKIDFFEPVRLNADNPGYEYNEVVGYDGKTAEFDVRKITDNNAGGTYFMVGSYGVYFRSGAFRLATRTGNAYAEVTPRQDVGFERKVINSGAKVQISVTVSENIVTVNVAVDGVTVGQFSTTKIADEIAFDAAVASVRMVSEFVTEVILVK